MAADGGMHLDRNARLVGPLDGLDGPRPRAGKAPERVVNLRRRAVQRDAQPHQTGLFQLENGLPRQQRRCARRQRHLHALVRGVADQLEYVLSFQWIPAGKHENRHVHRGDLVDQRLPLRVRQLIGMSDRLGGRPAMFAGQVTRLGDLPDGQKRGLVEVQPATGGNIVHRFHEAST